MKKNYPLGIALFAFIAASCSKSNQNNATDYDNKNNRYAMPKQPDKNADVFFVYPTQYLGDDSVYVVTDTGMPNNVDNLLRVHTQKDTFETVNFYASYYRQAGLEYLLSQEDGSLTNGAEKVATIMGNIPSDDI
jgi:hypothetical protein